MEAATVTGPAKNLIQFARNASPQAEVSIVTYYRGDEPGAFATAVKTAGVELDLVRERGRFDRAAIAQLREIIARRKPDIVQTHNVKSNFLFRLSGLHRNYRWLAFHHGYTMPDWKQQAYDQLDRWSLRATHRVVTVCEPFAAQLTAIGIPRERIRILHNSVAPMTAPDPAATAALRGSLGGASHRLILSIGRLSREKGHSDLLDAFALYRKMPSAPPAKLVLLGDGHERARLQAQAERLGFVHDVHFAGHIPNVTPYYFAADAFALPSHSEGSPNVVLEAMAAGLPVAATAVGGVPEILTSGKTGWVVKPSAPADMAQALHQLLSEKEKARAMAGAALAHVRANFTPAQYRERLLEIYRELAAY